MLSTPSINGGSLRGWLRNAPPDNGDYWRRCKVCQSPMPFAGRRCTGARHHEEADSFLMYASRTGTRQNLRAMAINGWRLLAAPNQPTYPRAEPPFGFAIDNGAWSAYSSGTPFDAVAFMAIVERLHVSADWIVIPDIVAGGLDSLRFSESWIPRLDGAACPLLLAVQNGMSVGDVRPFLAPGKVGIFLGGDTKWKLGTMSAWGDLAREVGCYYHVGRVNSARRIQHSRQAGAHSCDGTSATRFSKNVPRLTRAADAAIPGGLFSGMDKR